jgi:serine protease Do
MSPASARLVFLSVASAAALAACERSGGTSAGASDPGIATASLGAETTQHQAAPAAARAAANRATTASRRTALVDATQRLAPAVVSIHVVARQRVANRSGFDLFFLPQQDEQVIEGYGTGFVFRSDGYIITNQHVVAGAEKITVSLADGSDVPGEVVGQDPTTDIAVVRVKRTGLSTAPIGRSNDLMIGEWVVALGNPYAYLLGNSEPTVTVGVVSATGRNILPTGEQPGLYLDMIQTDAAINPGNSGGPLANASGEVVGVNSSIFSSSGGSIGLGFAIPIERATSVAEELIRSGAVRRAWLGLDVEGASGMRDWRSTGGVPVTAVTPDGPAAHAGIKRGDVLVSANGHHLRNYLDWEAAKLDSHVGDAITVTVRSGSDTATRRIVTGDLPTTTAAKVTVLKSMQLVTVDAGIRAEKNIRSQQGALIFHIEPAVSRSTGLQAGDVILAINNVRIRDAAQVAELLGALQPRQAIRVYFERDGQILFTDLAFA